jgi:HlyD family secretion protein
VILQDGAPWVRVWLPERAYSLIGPGSPARVRVEGISGELRGHVLDVSRESEFTPHYALTERERVYLVYETRVALDDAPAALRPGAPAEVSLALPTLKTQAGR